MEFISQFEIEAAIGRAAHEVFETMLHLPLKIEPSVRRNVIEPESFHGVMALVSVAGSWTGTARLSCSPAFAQKLAGALLLAEYSFVDEDVLDAVAEVANMIIGNVKTIFEERLGPLGLTIPTVIYGRNYKTRSAGVKDWVLVRMHSGEDIMDVNFCLRQSKAPSRSPRPDLADIPI